MRTTWAEADKMVQTLPWLSGSISGVTANHNDLVCDFNVWQPVDSHTRDMSDLTGVDTTQLVPNDTILREDSGGVSVVADSDGSDLPTGTTDEGSEQNICVRCGCVVLDEYLCEPCFAFLKNEAGLDDMSEPEEDTGGD